MSRRPGPSYSRVQRQKGFRAVSPDLGLFLVFAVPIAVYDLRELRIPDALSLGGTGAFILARVAFSGPDAFGEPLAACVVGFGVFCLIRRATGGKLGLGDAKLSALVAVAAGLRGWLVAILAASLAGLAFVAVLAATRRAVRHRRVAFGPFLALGGVAGILTRGCW